MAELRLYTGTALLGSVVCGLAFGWWEHRELAQWIGAGVAMLVCWWLKPERRDG